MLVGTTLSLMCLVGAMAFPWAAVENPSADTNAQIFLWVYDGPKLKAAFQNFYPPGGDSEPLSVSGAVDSLATVSGISSAVLTLSLLTQLLAFAATTRTWVALNKGAGAARVCAREASMQLNGATFLMMIFCVCTYLSSFNRVVSALGSSASSSNLIQPGFGFAFAAALLSFLSLLMVAGLGFRKAWRANVVGEAATVPLLVVTIPTAAGTGVFTESTTLTSSSSTGAEKFIPTHLLRELLEAAESKETECPVCLDKITTATGQFTACGHLFCNDCIEELIKEKGHRRLARCPTCRGAI